MTKIAKTWANKANAKGIINVNKIETCGVANYDIDCGGFGWCRMNSKEFNELSTLLNENVKITTTNNKQ